MRLLPLILAALLLAWPPPASAQDRPEYPPDWDPEMWSFHGDIPTRVKIAMDNLEEGKVEEGRLELTGFFVQATDRGEETARGLMVAKGWRRHRLDFFDAVRAEVRPWGSDPHQVYERALALGREAGLTGNPFLWQDQGLKGSTAWGMHLWSSNHGHRLADFEIAMAKLAMPGKEHHGVTSLRLLGDAGYRPAIEQLAARYESGAAFPRDDARALYWALRGVEADLPLEEQVSRLRARLPASTVREVESWKRQPYP